MPPKSGVAFWLTTVSPWGNPSRITSFFGASDVALSSQAFVIDHLNGGAEIAAAS